MLFERDTLIIQVEKRSIDIYEEGTVIPKCQFTAKFIQRDREIVPFEHQASLSGAKRPNNIIVFDIDPPAVLSGKLFSTTQCV